MASQTIINKALERWNIRKDEIQTMSTVNTSESKATQLARIARVRKDYAYFVEYYFSHWCTGDDGAIIPSAKFHIQAAKQILDNRNIRAVFKWARGHAKSTHMDVFIPLWLKCQQQRQINVMVLVGKSQDNANVLLGDIQFELENNSRYIHDFGGQMQAGSWTEGAFVTQDGTAFFARGRGQSPRGLRYRNHRPDYIVIDDLDDDELCQNETRVRKMHEWLWEALYASLGADGGRFIMVGNLISKNSVLARVADNEMVHVSQVNIYDRNGNPSWQECWSPQRIHEAEQTMGYRSFQKEYMNNPITEGAVFMQRHIHYGKILTDLRQYKQLICYTDPSFKNSATADYKATMLVGRTPAGEFHLLKAYADRCSVSTMVSWHYQIAEWVAGRVPVLYFMEANFMQDLILNEFKEVGIAMGNQIPIRGDARKKPDKFARIEAMQPIFERGIIIFNEQEKESPGMKVLQEQLLSFEKGTRANDDAPDALEGAVWMLNHRNRTTNAPYIFGTRHSYKW